MWVGYDPTENFELPGRKLKREIFGEIDVGGRDNHFLQEKGWHIMNSCRDRVGVKVSVNRLVLAMIPFPLSIPGLAGSSL